MARKPKGGYVQASTQMFYLESQGWDELKKRLQKDGHTIARMSDSLTANVGAIARRGTKAEIDSVFKNIGRESIKHYGKKTVKSKLVFSNKLGGYVSSKKQNWKESSFDFESVAAQRSKGKFHKTVSQVAFNSRLANLWEEDHVYSKASPWFWTDDGSSKGLTGRWGVGAIRKAKPYFLNGATQKVLASVPQAIDRVEKKYKDEL